MITQFQGETREEAIVNHFSLDIVEEDLFFAYIKEMGYDIDSDDEILESLCKMWREKQETELAVKRVGKNIKNIVK